MIGLLIGNWKLILIGIVAVAVGAYIWHCESVKEDWAKAKAIGRQQEAENARQALRDLTRKERSDENYERNIARLNNDVARLRNTSTSNLPTAAPGSASAERVTLDRAELGTALRSYREEVARGREEIRGLIGEGAKAVEGLDEAKRWAKDREM